MRVVSTGIVLGEPESFAFEVAGDLTSKITCRDPATFSGSASRGGASHASELPSANTKRYRTAYV
jgi:hypothetical protein